MPIPSLYAVRLMNADVSAGFQLRFVSDAAAEKGLSMLPGLYAFLCGRLLTASQHIRCALEFAAVEEDDRSLCSGLNIRLLFPQTTSAVQASSFSLTLCEETIDWINRGELRCVCVRSAQDGLAAQLARASRMKILSRQRCVGRCDDASLLYYAPAARDLGVLNTTALFRTLRQFPGCGVSLTLLHAPDRILDTLRSAADMLAKDSVVHTDLLRLADLPDPVNMQIALWEIDPSRSRESNWLTVLLENSGLCCHTIKLPTLTQAQRYALIHDPWSLLHWTHQKLGGRLAASATLYSSQELQTLFACFNEEAKAPTPAFHVHLNQEELQALGVSEEDELLERAMSREQIDMLRTAVTQVRTVLADRSLSPVMPYAASLGFFYEMMVRACIEPGLLVQENRYRAKASGYGKAYTGEPPLSHFDFISYTRVKNYSAQVRLGGKSLSPLAWNVWFNCMKCMRLMRNKVHTRLGSVEREELECMYRLMLFPGHEHKLNAIRYMIDHPHPRADDGENRNLKILHAESGHAAKELLDYIARFPVFFDESLLSFILRCADGEWLSS